MALSNDVRWTLFGIYFPLGLGLLVTLIASTGSLQVENTLLLGIVGWIFLLFAIWLRSSRITFRLGLCLGATLLAVWVVWYSWPLPLEGTVRTSLMIPFDTVPDHFPVPADLNPDDPMQGTYQDIFFLVANGLKSCVKKSGGQFDCTTEHISPNKAPEFFDRVLQFYILQSVDTLQRDVVIVRTGYPPETRSGIETPDRTKYPTSKFMVGLAHSACFQTFVSDPLQVQNVVLPKGAEVTFEETATNGKSVQCSLHLTRPGYFDLDFSVENSVGTAVGAPLPKNFVTDPSLSATTMAWTFFITMHYKVQRRSFGGFRSDVYAQWAQELFTRLEGVFGNRE